MFAFQVLGAMTRMGEVIDLKTRQVIEPSFQDRLERIRASMEKINRLLADIRQLSQVEGQLPEVEDGPEVR